MNNLKMESTHSKEACNIRQVFVPTSSCATSQDHTDWKRFKDWLTARDPFTFEDSNLHLLSTGLLSIAGEDK